MPVVPDETSIRAIRGQNTTPLSHPFPFLTEQESGLVYCTCNSKHVLSFCQVVLKIIKHSHEEGAGGTDLVQGVLLGLVVDNRLEITNCFPFPKHTEDEDFDTGNYSIGSSAVRLVE